MLEISVIIDHLTRSSSFSLGRGCKGDSACALLAAISTPDIICWIDLPPFEAIGLDWDSPSRHSCIFLSMCFVQSLHFVCHIF